MGFEEYAKQKRKINEGFGAQGQNSEEQKQVERQQKLGEMLFNMEQAQKERGLASGGETGFGSESMDALLSGTSFAERTEYYFKEQGLLTAKEERYQKLSEDTDGSVAQFAEEHKNTNAKKRKKSAKSAAQNFKKARDLEDAASGKDMSAIEEYKSRDEIMRARMAGMIDAAKVKATSAEDEGYRIAKAKLKCLSVLHDQLLHLKTDEHRAEFVKAEKKLIKELNSARKEMTKYSEKQTDQKWRSENGMDDPQVIDEIVKNCGNETVTAEDVRVLLPGMIAGKEKSRPEYREAFEKCKANNVYKDMGEDPGNLDRVIMNPCYYVRRDKNGKPVNKNEQKKADWNRRWCEACSDRSKSGERITLLEEACKRYEKMSVPDLNEVKKKGAIYFYKKDPVGIYSVSKFALTIDNLKEKEPFIEGFEKIHKEFAAKMEIWRMFSAVLTCELGEKHLMKQGKDGWEISIINKNRLYTEDEKKEAEEEYKDDHTYKMNLLEEKYAPLNEARKKDREENTVNNQTLKLQTEKEVIQDREHATKAYKRYNKESYKVYSSLVYGDLYLKNPLYKSYFDDKISFRNNTLEITRCGACVMRKVNFDDNWQPISEEDKKNHEWNMKYAVTLNSMVKQKTKKNKAKEEPEAGSYEEKAITEMAKEELVRFYTNGFKLPDPEVIKKELIDRMRSGKSFKSDYFESFIKSSGDIKEYMNKALAYSNLIGLFPDIKIFANKEENQKMNAYYTAGMHLAGLVNAYTEFNYGISFSERKLSLLAGVSDDPNMLEAVFLEEYKKGYEKAMR